MLSGACLACECLSVWTKVVLVAYVFDVLQLRFYSELICGGLWHPTVGKCPHVLRPLCSNNFFWRLLIQRLLWCHKFMQILGLLGNEFGVFALWTEGEALVLLCSCPRPFLSFLFINLSVLIERDSRWAGKLPSCWGVIRCCELISFSCDFRSQPTLLLRPLNAMLLFMQSEILIRELDWLHESVVVLY